MKINLHIERVVLEGIDVGAGDRELIRESIASELGRMLGDGGLGNGLSGGISRSRVMAGDVQLTADKPVEFGRRIAGSVFKGVGGG